MDDSVQKFNMVDVSRSKTEKRVKRHKVLRLLVILVLLLTALLSIWAIVYSAADKNSYRITISGNRADSLSLCFDRNFKNGYNTLKCLGIEEVNDSRGATYLDGIESYIDGIISGKYVVETTENGKKGGITSNDEYIATKLYLKNIQDRDINYDPLKYKVRLRVLEQSQNALSAARFMIVYDADGENRKEVYALPAADGSQEKVAAKYENAETFVEDPYNPGSDWLCKNITTSSISGQWEYDTAESGEIIFELEPQQVTGFVIAFWYEASDPEHNNTIMGGFVTFSVEFTTISVE